MQKQSFFRTCTACILVCALTFPGKAQEDSTTPDSETQIKFWYGDRQNVGACLAQPDFNVLGNVTHWEQVDTLSWSLNGRTPNPLSFRAYRRLAEDGDFNIDLPMGSLKSGSNRLIVTANLRNGKVLRQDVELRLHDSPAPTLTNLRWSDVQQLHQVGLPVDGFWEVDHSRLRCRQRAYDRLFLMGEPTWKDYEVATSLKVHRVSTETNAYSHAPGLGIIFRFAGHVVGGPRNFPSAQPQWGYQPFGAIAWLRWTDWRQDVQLPPELQFYPGDSDRSSAYGKFELRVDQTYMVRARCETLPDGEQGQGISLYSFKIWPMDATEPIAWAWQHTQASHTALRFGGFAFVAHHVDASFGDVEVLKLDESNDNDRK